MEENYLSKILESIGWPQDENFIPVANDENQKLIKLINELTKSKFDKSKYLENKENRARILKSQHEYAKQEIEENLKLIAAHNSQNFTEYHLLKLSENEENRLLSQINDVKYNQNELEKFMLKTKLETEKIQKNLAALAERIHWSKGAIDEFREAMTNGQKTKEIIEKYCKANLSKAEVLESKRKLLQEKITKNQNHLANAYEDQKSLEQILDRTAQLYRKAHIERRQMVSTWKDAVNQMNQREKDIDQAENDLENARKMTEEKNESLKEQKEFLEQQLQNNRDSEIAIEELNIHCSRQRKRMADLIDMMSLKQNELATLKKIVHNVSIQLQNQRQKNRQCIQENTTKQSLLVKEADLVEILIQKEQNFKNRNLSAKDRLKQIDEMVESEERIIKMLQNEITRLGSALYRSQQQLRSLQNDEKVLNINCETLKSLIQTLNNTYKNHDKELLRETELVYGIDFNIQQLERRLNNMKGIGSEKNTELERKVVYLEKQFERKISDLNVLQSQVTKVEDEIKKMTMSYINDNNEYEKMINKLKERQMNIEGGEKEVSKQILINQERLVEFSMLKIKIKQLENELQKHDDKSFNLEQHKLSLDMTMKERLLDIKLQKEMLLLKKRNLNEEFSQFRADIGERSIKIEAFRKRYECAMELLGRNEDGTIVTATQIKVQNAQERYILLKEGNELNEKVSQAEKDIQAMENTLRLMNYSNENYRGKFKIVDEENPLAAELNDVQKLYSSGIGKLKTLKANVLQSSSQLIELEERKETLEKIIEDIKNSRLDNNDILVKIHKEILDQKTKLQRAERELKKAKKMCRSKINDPEYMQIFEKDLNVKELEERNSSVLQQMADLVENNLEIGPALSKSLYERGLVVPNYKRSKSQASWKSNASGMGSEYSIQIVSASSKDSEKSSESRGSSKFSVKSNMTPSVVMIGFPGNVTMRTSESSKSNFSSRY